MSYGRYEYYTFNGADLFCVYLTPEKEGRFPTVVIRNPYQEMMVPISDDEAVARYLEAHTRKLDRGYAVAIQHCRGTGRSSGDFIPCISEHEDTRSFYERLREQPFYNGELFLHGGSYSSSVHFCAAPWDGDIKGAVLEIQDCERYNIMYRNGHLKAGLHGNWYIGQYKKHTLGIHKNYTPESFMTLPLSALSESVFGEPCEDFNECIRHPYPNDAFWQTRFGGAEAHDAIKHANIPILLRTGWYDIYTGGVISMWNGLDDKTRARSALIVTPNDHGDTLAKDSVYFAGSRVNEAFGDSYIIDWFDHVRRGGKAPAELGKISYYRMFEGKYGVCDKIDSDSKLRIPLGSGRVTYTYNPYNPSSFRGGLSTSFGGTEFQDPPGSRYDIVSLYSEPFENDTFIKGKITARLRVSSDCEDTCFILRISLEKAPGSFEMRPDADEFLREKRMSEGGDLGIRDDIRSLCFELGDYTPGTDVDIDFTMDEHAFKIAAGERLRFDIASADKAHYVRHTNTKGLFSEQTTAVIAHNTVDLSRSYIDLPTE